MQFTDYSDATRATRLMKDYSYIDHPNLPYFVLGLVGEAGEVAEEIKKLIRDGEGTLTPERRERIALEMGDVLWYLVQIGDEIGYPLDTIAEMNIKKIHVRWDDRLK